MNFNIVGKIVGIMIFVCSFPCVVCWERIKNKQRKTKVTEMLLTIIKFSDEALTKVELVKFIKAFYTIQSHFLIPTIIFMFNQCFV